MNLYQKIQKKIIKKNPQKVLLIKKNYKTDYKSILNNLSDFIYQKEEININQINKKELLKKMINAKYIIIDEYDQKYDIYDFDNTIGIYVNHKNGLYMRERINEKEKEFLNKMSYIIVGNDKYYNYYLENKIEVNKIKKFGFYLSDKFFSKKFKNEAYDLLKKNEEIINTINILYLPKDPYNINLEDLKKIESIENVSLFILNLSINKTKYDIEISDVKKIFMIANCIISNENDLIFEMQITNKNIKNYQSRSELEQIIDEIKNNNFKSNNELTNYDWNEYDNGMCSRKIVQELMRG